MFHKGNNCPVKLRQLDVSRHSSSAEYALKQKENPSSWFSLCSSKLSLNSCLTRTARPVVFPRKKVSNVIFDDVFDTWRRGLVVNETSKRPGASSVIFFILFSLSLFKKFFFSLFTWSPRSFGLHVFTCILIFWTKIILTDRQFYFLLLPMDLYETHNFELITGLPSIETVNSHFFFRLNSYTRHLQWRGKFTFSLTL